MPASSLLLGFQNISQQTLPEPTTDVLQLGEHEREEASFTFPAQTSGDAGQAGPGPVFLKWFLTRILSEVPKFRHQFSCCLCGTPKPQVESICTGVCADDHMALLSYWKPFRTDRRQRNMGFLPGTGAHVPAAKRLPLQESESKNLYTTARTMVCCVS